MADNERWVLVDQGSPDCVALGLCWCGARYLQTTRRGALARLADHEARAHIGNRHARDALVKFDARAARARSRVPAQP